MMVVDLAYFYFVLQDFKSSILNISLALLQIHSHILIYYKNSFHFIIKYINIPVKYSKEKMKEGQENQINPNTIMVEKVDNIIYLPGYMTISIRNFRSLSLEELSAEVYITIKLAINVMGLKDETIRQLEGLVLNFPLQGNISMDKKKNKGIDVTSYMVNEPYRLKIFEIKKIFNLSVFPYIRLTPFELVDLILTVNIKTITLRGLDSANKEVKCEIKINLMDLYIDQNQIQKKINYNSEGILGNYDLAQAKLCVQYTKNAQEKTLGDLGKYFTIGNIFKFNRKKVTEKGKDKKQEEKKSEKIKNFQYAHFHIPLYKFPCVSLCTILIPLVLLGIINLAVFFQSPALADRVGNIATLMIAFIGMISVIRAQVPPTPSITVIEALVYLEISTTLLCLIQSLMTRKDIVLVQKYTQVFFLISCGITGLVIILPIFMMFLHKVYLEKSYNLSVDEEIEQKFEEFVEDEKGKAEAKKYFSKFKHLLGPLNKPGSQERNSQFKKRLEEIQSLISTSKMVTSLSSHRFFASSKHKTKIVSLI